MEYGGEVQLEHRGKVNVLKVRYRDFFWCPLYSQELPDGPLNAHTLRISIEVVS